ncbi:DDE-type integrase/transposase/recombinase [Sulfitobacter sp. BDSS02]|nr:DDE-type integrase/transposase/recombinase [Sulfitobacter sp. BDSS02]MBR9852087.1 DDE-type integrase/transposase/recombinase [Paracoccaceae bacterium]
MTKASKARRTLIETTALHLFAQRGFSEVSIRDIAQACEIGESALYRHMSSKEKLAVRVFREGYLGFAQEMLEAAPADASLTEKLSAYLRIMLKGFDADPVLLRFLLIQQHDILAQAITYQDVTPVTVVRDALVEAVEAGSVELADADTEKYFVSEASVYRILKSYDLITGPSYVVVSAADQVRDKTTRLNQLWQTDFTYLKVIGWGWFYLSTILDDYSRYNIAWKFCTTMKSGDVTDTLDLALQASGCDQAKVLHKPRLLSDNGSSYISGELADWLEDRQMDHVRGAPYHPQTQGKIERWHQTLKNRILLENYFLPGDLRQKIDAFVEHYIHRRYHESLQSLTPADVYFGPGQTILKKRERIKRKTIETRRLLHRKSAA